MTAGTLLDIITGVTTVEKVDARNGEAGWGVYGGMLTAGMPKASNGQTQAHEQALGSVAKAGSPVTLSGLPSRSTSGATGIGAEAGEAAAGGGGGTGETAGGDGGADEAAGGGGGGAGEEAAGGEGGGAETAGGADGAAADATGGGGDTAAGEGWTSGVEARKQISLVLE